MTTGSLSTESMTRLDLPGHRLHNQRIASHTFERPEQIVAWLGAVQAQDYLAGLWAIGLRMDGVVEGDIERAIAERKIVRTWPTRGTLHFVAADDARWMTELMAPRVLARSAGRLQREYALDDATAGRARDLFHRALDGGRRLSRDAMYATLEDGGVVTSGGRGLQLLWRLAQEGLICFGPREGKQQTFVLLDEWVPGARTMEPEAALAELTRRYFTSHGPATIRDFMWWSGLTMAEVRAGLGMAGPELASEVVDGETYWFNAAMEPIPGAGSERSAAYLLPNYDEYIVGYKDRSAVYTHAPHHVLSSNNVVFSNTIVIGGQVSGTWKRTIGKREVRIAAEHFAPLAGARKRAFSEAAARYGAFLELPIVMG